MSHAKDIGRRVKALRKQRNLTQAQLAAEIGVGLSTIGTIESGHYPPGRDNLAALAQFFGVPMEHLHHGAALAGDDPPLDPAQQAKEAIFLRLLRRLTDDQREAVALMMNAFLNPLAKNFA